MLYKRFKEFIAEQTSTQTIARKFRVAGTNWEKQGGAKLKNKCSQYTDGSDRHTACMYGGRDNDRGN